MSLGEGDAQGPCWPSTDKGVMAANLNDEIVRLYVEEQMSVREIAMRFRTSYGKIYYVLRKREVMERDRSHPTKSYLKVAEAIRDRITAGEWKPGEKIPSQVELAETFGVSTQTVSAAVSHLREHGYLRVLPGRGTYVRLERYWGQQEEALEMN